MTRQVEFHFDFGSPNAYFCHEVLPGIARHTGATFAYVPVLIGGVFKLTNNVAPLVAFKDVRNKKEYMMLEMGRFVGKHRLDRYKWNPYFPVNTLGVMRGAIAAEMDGVLAPYVDAVFRAMWEDERPMSEPDAIRAVLTDAGLDADRLMARAADQDVKDKLAANTSALVERGGFGLPTFFVDGEMYFGKDRLTDVEDAITRGPA